LIFSRITQIILTADVRDCATTATGNGNGLFSGVTYYKKPSSWYELPTVYNKITWGQKLESGHIFWFTAIRSRRSCNFGSEYGWITSPLKLKKSLLASLSKCNHLLWTIAPGDGDPIMAYIFHIPSNDD